MHYKIGKSTSKNCMEAVEEATNTLRNPKLILFCSGIDQFEEFTKIIKKNGAIARINYFIVHIRS